jgi:hypothetical protein
LNFENVAVVGVYPTVNYNVSEYIHLRTSNNFFKAKKFFFGCESRRVMAKNILKSLYFSALWLFPADS